MKIAVIGAGNIGTALACEIERNTNSSVSLFTRDRSTFAKNLKVYDENSILQYTARKVNVVDNIIDIKGFDIYFFTTPKNVIEKVICDIAKVANKNSIFIYVPGTGGVEYIHTKYCKDIKMIGMQRSPYIARLIKKGESVELLSKKEILYLASINCNDFEIIEELLKIKIIAVNNYLCVTFTPSNPILHTARLYQLFHKHGVDYIYKQNPLFYKEWNNEVSSLLIACDDELQNICKSIVGLNLAEVVSLKIYYNCKNEQELTDKIKSIPSFAKIKSPMICTEDGYMVDTKSRYFLEDFPHGLAYIKAFAMLLNVETPSINKVINWFNSQFGSEDGKVEDIALKKMNESGILSRSDIVNFYNIDANKAGK